PTSRRGPPTPMNGGRVPMEKPSNPTRLRLGPRPLPQHLSLAAATWLNSAAVLPALRLASATLPEATRPPAPTPPASQKPDARAKLRQRWAALQREAETADPAKLAAALQAEGLRRFDQLLSGVERYRRHPSHRSLTEAPVLWEQGTTKLRDYRTAN